MIGLAKGVVVRNQAVIVKKAAIVKVSVSEKTLEQTHSIVQQDNGFQVSETETETSLEQKPNQISLQSSEQSQLLYRQLWLLLFEIYQFHQENG